MAEQLEADFQMALTLSLLRHQSPEPTRIESSEDSGVGQGPPDETTEVKSGRTRPELMAAAADKRTAISTSEESVKDVDSRGFEEEGKSIGASLENVEGRTGISETELTAVEANQLFLMIFGERVSRDVLAQWCNQGIRFSDDPETSMGLVQHEGGPCGVLAAIQAFLLKYLLFSPEECHNVLLTKLSNLDLRVVAQNEYVLADILPSLSEETKSRSLVRSMSEILFLCGRNDKAVIASLNILDGDLLESVEGSKDEVIAKALGGLSVESGSDLQKVLRVNTCTSLSSAIQKLKDVLPIFQSRVGALLFLMSALLSRGLDTVQEDMDDPSQPLVTAPFGHASQEIVNLLLSGSAVAHVFDGNMDLGGGMFLKGISTTVEVGFLTLLESFNFCTVGQCLKNPRWPIWVLGSESHYTVLFALDPKVQEENNGLEKREAEIRMAFDDKDESGGGGFISVEDFNQLVTEMGINLPREKAEHLCGTGFIVWSDFWKVLLDLDERLGGLKGLSGMMGKNKVFDLYHFNGIAKSVMNGGQGSSSRYDNQAQRPRLTKLRVSVQAEESSCAGQSGIDSRTRVSEGQLAQHVPLVDCIRTRWPGAVCNWAGDAPSIV